jgi:hypothetical protein
MVATYVLEIKAVFFPELARPFPVIGELGELSF